MLSRCYRLFTTSEHKPRQAFGETALTLIKASQFQQGAMLDHVKDDRHAKALDDSEDIARLCLSSDVRRSTRDLTKRVDRLALTL